MNANPNETHPQSGMARTAKRDQPEASQTVLVGAKLKEAEAKLMEAEAGLAGKPRETADLQTRDTEPGAQPPHPANQPRTQAHPAEEPKREPREKKAEPSVPFTEQLAENVAGPLCYLFGWLSGLVFLLVDRRPFVRYHATQAVAVFATLSLALLVLSDFLLGAVLPHMAGVLLVARRLVELVWLVAAVMLMLKASSGQRPHVGAAGDYADRAARRP